MAKVQKISAVQTRVLANMVRIVAEKALNKAVEEYNSPAATAVRQAQADQLKLDVAQALFDKLNKSSQKDLKAAFEVVINYCGNRPRIRFDMNNFLEPEIAKLIKKTTLSVEPERENVRFPALNEHIPVPSTRIAEFQALADKIDQAFMTADTSMLLDMVRNFKI